MVDARERGCEGAGLGRRGGSARERPLVYYVTLVMSFHVFVLGPERVCCTCWASVCEAAPCLS